VTLNVTDDRIGSAPNLSECCVRFYLRSILNTDLWESLVQGALGWCFCAWNLSKWM